MQFRTFGPALLTLALVPVFHFYIGEKYETCGSKEDNVYPVCRRA